MNGTMESVYTGILMAVTYLSRALQSPFRVASKSAADFEKGERVAGAGRRKGRSFPSRIGAPRDAVQTRQKDVWPILVIFDP